MTTPDKEVLTLDWEALVFLDSNLSIRGNSIPPLLCGISGDAGPEVEGGYSPIKGGTGEINK
jgi:hypothetical protein